MGRLDLRDPPRCEDLVSHPAAAMVDAAYSAIAQGEYVEAAGLMDALVGAEAAARWLSIELERAGKIPLQLDRFRCRDTHGYSEREKNDRP